MKTFYVIGSSKCHYTRESITYLRSRIAGCQIHLVDKETDPALFKRQFDNVNQRYNHHTMPCVFEYLNNKWVFVGGCDDTKRKY